jgi:hypothetical protein
LIPFAALFSYSVACSGCAAACAKLALISSVIGHNLLLPLMTLPSAVTASKTKNVIFYSLPLSLFVANIDSIKIF